MVAYRRRGGPFRTPRAPTPSVRCMAADAHATPAFGRSRLSVPSGRRAPRPASPPAAAAAPRTCGRPCRQPARASGLCLRLTTCCSVCLALAAADADAASKPATTPFAAPEQAPLSQRRWRTTPEAPLAPACVAAVGLQAELQGYGSSAWAAPGGCAAGADKGLEAQAARRVQVHSMGVVASLGRGLQEGRCRG